jgi:hypothetical protein
MKKDERQRGGPEQVADSREPQRASHPAPGKVTRTSRLSPTRGPAMQRKAAAPAPGAAAPQARSGWDLTMDPWMDAAHRGVTALVESGQDAEPIQAMGLEETPDVPVRLPGNGGGAQMPEDVQDKMEAAFGADFSPVRIHEGAHAEAIGALAYTQGTDIHFAPGQYQPSSQRGQELIGHELAHVVQQSEGRVAPTVQAKGLAINDDTGLEAEADELGARAARGEIVRSGGGDVVAGQGPAQRKAAGAVIQLSPQPSHWGRFIDRTYEQKPSGCHITLEFEPGPNVDATKIGLTQSVRGDSGTTPVTIDPTNEARMVASGPGAGYGIDRIPERNNPVYGARSLTSSESLSDTPRSNASAGVTPSPGSATTPPTATYELGHRHGTVTPKNAWLDDAPQSASLTNTVFESTALGIEGAQAGTYYGSVRWGWQRGSSGISLVPFALVSQGVPSQNFLAAAQAWNTSTALGTLETRNDPTQCHARASGAFTPAFTLPRGTRVTQINATSLAGVVYDFVRILDGTRAGTTTYIQNTDLRDRGDGAATADLPVPDVHVIDAGDLKLNEFVAGATSTPIPRSTRCVPNPSDVRTVRTPLELQLIRIQIVDGPLTGQSGYVRRTALRKERP